MKEESQGVRGIENCVIGGVSQTLSNQSGRTGCGAKALRYVSFQNSLTALKNSRDPARMGFLWEVKSQLQSLRLDSTILWTALDTKWIPASLPSAPPPRPALSSPNTAEVPRHLWTPTVLFSFCFLLEEKKNKIYWILYINVILTTLETMLPQFTDKTK